MAVRTRGFLVLLASLAAGGVLFFFRSGLLVQGAAGGGLIGEVIKWGLTIPLVFAGIGLVELAGGVPFTQADEAFQRQPAYLKAPVVLVGGGLFLWAFLWVVAKALGA